MLLRNYLFFLNKQNTLVQCIDGLNKHIFFFLICDLLLFSPTRRSASISKLRVEIADRIVGKLYRYISVLVRALRSCARVSV